MGVITAEIQEAIGACGMGNLARPGKSGKTLQILQFWGKIFEELKFSEVKMTYYFIKHIASKLKMFLLSLKDGRRS